MASTSQLQRPVQAAPAGGFEQPLESLDRHGFLFGKKITKSLSPYLHGVVYGELGLNWAQVRLDSDDMESFLQLIKHPQFYGKSKLTMGVASKYRTRS